MKLYLTIIVLLSISTTGAHSSWALPSVPRKVEWNTFKVRWGPDPLATDGETFIRQPRTVQQALQEQYEKLPNGLGDQCVGKTTVGYRYWKANDTGAIILFDKQGTISGVQMAFPRSSVDARFYSFDMQKMYNREMINGVDMYTLTAYFVDPATICTAGRTLSRLEHEGTGTGLFIQNGTDPLRDSVTIPLWENEISNTKWTRGACFKTMGQHYWYDTRLNTNCSQFLPSFLLYNKGQLSGFGWDVARKLEFSRRTEFPSKAAVLSFLIPVPTCMPKLYDDVGGFTTMHMYFNADPANLEC